MKSKRNKLILILLLIPLVLVACSKNRAAPKTMKKEGIQPYALSENEKYILKSFAMEGRSQIISFKAPKEAISLELKTYRLGDNQKWDLIESGGVSLDKERKGKDRLIGNLAIELGEDHEIKFNINTNGRSSFETDKIILDTEEMISAKVFLEDYKEIELDREIPLALMVYNSGPSIRTYSTEDYFNPNEFKGMDLVQVVTASFTEDEL